MVQPVWVEAGSWEKRPVWLPAMQF
jgi:hypothetical protein